MSHFGFMIADHYYPVYFVDELKLEGHTLGSHYRFQDAIWLSKELSGALMLGHLQKALEKLWRRHYGQLKNENVKGQAFSAWLDDELKRNQEMTITVT